MNKLLPALMSFVLLLCVAVPFAHGEQSSEVEKNLPEGLNAKNFINWLAPNINDSFVRIIQTRKWNKNQYVIMVCVAKTPMPADESEPKKGECRDEDFDVYIGVVSLSGQNYTFDFRTDIPVTMNVDDSFSNYNYKLGNCDLKLDLAPYRVNENTTAIGLRRASHTGYAGGGAGSEQLWLLMPYKKHLYEILTLDVEDYEILAEDWNPDGSRNHGGYYYKSTLHALKTKTNGFYDYLVKTSQSSHEGKEVKKSIINTYYIWSEEKRQYSPKK
jgi:hypothetical protein